MTDIRCSNPNLDVEALVKDFIEDVFGEKITATDISNDLEFISMLEESTVFANQIDELISKIDNVDLADELLEHIECLLIKSIAYSSIASMYAASIMSSKLKEEAANDGA